MWRPPRLKKIERFADEISGLSMGDVGQKATLASRIDAGTRLPPASTGGCTPTPMSNAYRQGV